MLNKPKFMSPSTNLQECVVDANADEILFSCIVDGNEAISAWQIIIYDLENSSIIADTGKQVLTTPFFPIDNKNKNVGFERDLKPYVGSNLTNRIDPYYWAISFWSVADKGNDAPTTTSCEEVFYANPVVAPVIQYGVEKTDGDGNKYIDYKDLTKGIILNSSKYYFKATYEQAESIGLKRYGWRIKDVDNDRVLMDTITHNQIYGTEDNISCFYNGFLNSENYSIEVYIETQNNAVIITEPVNFSVLYEITYLTNDFKVSALNKEAAVMLDWAEATIIGGRENGNIQYKPQYPIIDYSAEIPNTSVVISDDSSIVFDYNANSNLDIPESCYVVISTQMLDNSERVLFSAEGTDEDGYELVRKLIFDGSCFIYTIIDSKGIPKTIKTEETYIPNQYKWYIVTMSPFLGENGDETWFRVVESNAIDGLYPSEDLYPSETLYPTLGVWDKLKDGDE